MDSKSGDRRISGTASKMYNLAVTPVEASKRSISKCLQIDRFQRAVAHHPHHLIKQITVQNMTRQGRRTDRSCRSERSIDLAENPWQSTRARSAHFQPQKTVDCGRVLSCRMSVCALIANFHRANASRREPRNLLAGRAANSGDGTQPNHGWPYPATGAIG